MFLLGPIDPLLAVLYTAYRVRALRAIVLVFGLIPAVLYALPPERCGCMPTPFRRCSGSMRDLAYRAAMRSDLKNLASQQEIFFSDHDTYSADFEELQFRRSDGVEVTLYASTQGWAARTNHLALGETASCAVSYGSPPAHGFDELAGVGPSQLVCTF